MKLQFWIKVQQTIWTIQG